MDEREHQWHDFPTLPRLTILPWLIWGFLIASILGVVKVVTAQEIPMHVWTDGKTTINLMPGPCTDKVVKLFLESVGELDRFKAIESSWVYKDGQKKTHGGCWAEFSAKESGAPEPVLLLLFDDGDKHTVLKSEFLKKRGQVGV